MRWKLVTLSLVAGLSGLALGVSSTSASPTLTAPRTIRAFAVQKAFNFAPLSSRGIGDVFTITDVIYEQATKKLLGHDEILCTVTVPGPPNGPPIRAYCSATTYFRDGKVMAAGSFHFDRRSGDTVAIVGGTGAYDNARGTIHITPQPGNKPGLYLFHLLP